MFPAVRRVYFLIDGQPYPAGSTLSQPDLARSLELIARQGPRAFYGGQIAQAIMRDMATASSSPGDSAKLRPRRLPELPGEVSAGRSPAATAAGRS